MVKLNQNVVIIVIYFSTWQTSSTLFTSHFVLWCELAWDLLDAYDVKYLEDLYVPAKAGDHYLADQDYGDRVEIENETDQVFYQIATMTTKDMQENINFPSFVQEKVQFIFIQVVSGEILPSHI